MLKNNHLLVVTWDGKSKPLAFCHVDAHPEFDLLIFDYSGCAEKPVDFAWPVDDVQFFSAKTECKGQIFTACSDLAQDYADASYIGLFDDDVVFKVSEVNHMLFLANVLELDVFSPSLTHDSFHSHTFTLSRPEGLWREVPWVEVMAPWYRAKLLKNGQHFFEQSISSWGVDIFAVPLLQKICGMQRTGILDAVSVSHIRPITSWNRKYSNGRLALDEKWHMREYCLSWIKNNEASYFDDAFLMGVISSKKVVRQSVKRKLKKFFNKIISR